MPSHEHHYPHQNPHPEGDRCRPFWQRGYDHHRAKAPYAPGDYDGQDQLDAYGHGRRCADDDEAHESGSRLTSRQRAEREAPAPLPPPRLAMPQCGHPSSAFYMRGDGFRCRWCDNVEAAGLGVDVARLGDYQRSEDLLARTVSALVDCGVGDPGQEAADAVRALAAQRDDAERVAAERAGADPELRDLLLGEFGTTDPELIAEQLARWRDGLIACPQWAEDGAGDVDRRRRRLATACLRLAGLLIDDEEGDDGDGELVDALALVQVLSHYVDAWLGGVPVLRRRCEIVAGEKEEQRARAAQQSLPLGPPPAPKVATVDELRKEWTPEKRAELALSVMGEPQDLGWLLKAATFADRLAALDQPRPADPAMDPRGFNLHLLDQRPEVVAARELAETCDSERPAEDLVALAEELDRSEADAAPGHELRRLVDDDLATDGERPVVAEVLLNRDQVFGCRLSGRRDGEIGHPLTVPALASPHQQQEYLSGYAEGRAVRLAQIRRAVERGELDPLEQGVVDVAALPLADERHGMVLHCSCNPLRCHFGPQHEVGCLRRQATMRRVSWEPLLHEETLRRMPATTETTATEATETKEDHHG